MVSQSHPWVKVIRAQAKPQILNRLLALERRIIRYCLNLNSRYPSNLVHVLANLPPYPPFLQHLLSRYVLRTTISSDNSTAKATLLSSLRTASRRPKNKILPPSVALLQTAPDLPDPCQEILDYPSFLPHLH